MVLLSVKLTVHVNMECAVYNLYCAFCRTNCSAVKCTWQKKCCTPSQSCKKFGTWRFKSIYIFLNQISYMIQCVPAEMYRKAYHVLVFIKDPVKLRHAKYIFFYTNKVSAKIIWPKTVCKLATKQCKIYLKTSMGEDWDK